MVHFWLIERILRDSKKTPNLIVSSSRFAFCTYLFCTQHFFPTFSPSLVPFIMLWGLKLFRNNNHIIVEKKSWKCNNYSDHFNLTRKIQVNSLHCFYYFFRHFFMAIKSDFVVTWPIKMWAWTTACINLCTRFGTPSLMQCWKLQPKPKTETWRDTIQNISYITSSTATASFVHFHLLSKTSKMSV